MSRFSLSVRSVASGALALLAVPALAAGDRLLSFEQAPAGGERLSGWNATVTRTQLSATDGVYSVREDVPANTTGYATYEYAAPQDLSGCSTLIADLYNPGAENASVLVYLIDSAGKTIRIETVVPAGRWAHPAMMLKDRRLPTSFGLRDLPRVAPEARMVPVQSWDDKGCDLHKVSKVQVVVRATDKPQQIYFDYFRTTPDVSVDDLLTGWIDSYGQNSRVQFPGKITSDADLLRAKSDEDKALSRVATFGYDAYGGDAKGTKFNPTGFFRVDKTKTGWMLVTPLGTRFWSFGVNSVTLLDDGGVVNGKEGMFQDLPSTTGPLASAYVNKMVNGVPQTAFSFIKANAMRKYGVGRSDLWYGRAIQRMRAWGFNTVGAFSDRDMLPMEALPTTPKIGSYGAASIYVPLLPGEPMPDPYNPNFAARLNDNMWRVRPSDPMIVGYFVDNILPFSANYSRNYQVALPLAVLELNAMTSSAKAALVSRLQDQYGSIENLNAAWNTSVSSWPTFAASFKLSDRTNTALVNDAMYADLRAFLKDMARRYFSTVRTVLKTADPNHLYLGSRLDHADPDILNIMGEYADVVSVNVYQYSALGGEWSILKNLNKPVMISEFGFNSYERGMPGMFVEVANDAERGAAFKAFVKECMDQPNFVGAHIFQYQDQNPHGVSWMNENCNNGFVDIADTPYPYMVDAAKTIAGTLYPKNTNTTGISLR